MGIARLLAKGWILFCLFAGAHALRFALAAAACRWQSSLFAIGICAAAVRGHGPAVRGRLRRFGRACRRHALARAASSRII